MGVRNAVFSWPRYHRGHEAGIDLIDRCTAVMDLDLLTHKQADYVELYIYAQLL
jgi:hypothetical protein